MLVVLASPSPSPSPPSPPPCLLPPCVVVRTPRAVPWFWHGCCQGRRRLSWIRSLRVWEDELCLEKCKAGVKSAISHVRACGDVMIHTLIFDASEVPHMLFIPKMRNKTMEYLVTIFKGDWNTGGVLVVVKTAWKWVRPARRWVET